MRYHFDDELILKTTSKHESLYKWSIVEKKRSKSDLVPWRWTICYTAIDCTITHTLSRTLQFAFNNEDRTPSYEEKEIIKIRLGLGVMGPDGAVDNKTAHSMLGTNRNINEIWLNILPLNSDEENEICRAWGAVSCTSEVDFLEITNKDSLLFYAQVKPMTFDRYISNIRYGFVDSIVFTAGDVSGFYSQWSPGISADQIKVLTHDTEHKVIGENENIQPPRLGRVESWSINIGRRINFGEKFDRPN